MPTGTSHRVLPPTLIPESIWSVGKQMLRLPDPLAGAYIELVDRLGLRELGNRRDEGTAPVGGQQSDHAHRHFAQAFDGSAARAMLTMLDPRDQLGSTSNTLITCTAGNTLCLTDSPCGAAAASLAMLCTLADLREQKVLPRLPLTVRWVGAELSPDALKLAQTLFEALSPTLAAQAIFVEPTFVPWDVTDTISNTDLIKTLIHLSDDDAMRLLIVANFNGFLEKKHKRKEARDQLDELFRYASGINSFAIWIEPNQNRATASGGLFPWLIQQVQTAWQRFVGSSDESTENVPMFTSDARFWLPLQPDKSARVTLAVVSLKLARQPS